MTHCDPEPPLKGGVLLSEQGLTPRCPHEALFNCPFWESMRRLGVIGDEVTGEELRAVMLAAGFSRRITETLSRGVEIQFAHGDSDAPVHLGELRSFFGQHVGGIAHLAGSFHSDEGLRALMRDHARTLPGGPIRVLTHEDWTALRNVRFEAEDASVKDKSISWSEGALFWAFLGTEIDGEEVVLLETAEAFFFDHLLPDDVLVPLRKIGLGEMLRRTAKLGRHSELAELKSTWDRPFSL